MWCFVKDGVLILLNGLLFVICIWIWVFLNFYWFWVMKNIKMKFNIKVMWSVIMKRISKDIWVVFKLLY